MKTIVALFAAMIFLAGCSTIKPSPVKTIYCKTFEEPIKVAKSEAVKTNSKTFFMLNTGSMVPLIDYRDAIVVNQFFKFEDLKAGDIAVYAPKWSKYTVTHMCYDRRARNGNWRMYGIHNGSVDSGNMSKENFVGKVTEIYKTSPYNFETYFAANSLLTFKRIMIDFPYSSQRIIDKLISFTDNPIEISLFKTKKTNL